jgi:hypothetical protein
VNRPRSARNRFAEEIDMSGFLRAAATAAILAFATFEAAVAQDAAPPWQGLRNPNVIVDYIEPRPPFDPAAKNYAEGMAYYQRVTQIYQRMRKRQVLEELSAFLSPLKLPKTLRVRTIPCDTVNAFYSPDEYTVNMCYELLDAVERTAPRNTTPDGFTRQEVIVGAFLGILFHELGHAVSDIYSLPVLGREEDSADQIAGFVMQQFGPDVARIAIKGMAFIWYQGPFGGNRTPAYWDVHSTAGQRFYNFLCIGYGGHPQLFQELVDKFLPKDRVANCKHEYEQARNAFAKTLLPQVDRELMTKVQSIKWLRPEDGTW